MNRFNLLCSVVALVAANIVPASASAEERPHSSRGTAQFVPAGFVGTGYATHLGHYTEVGTVSISPTGQVDACAIYTAANGDELWAVITGQLNASGAITASVEYVGGTGRFAKASGSAELLGQILPDGTLAVAVKGTINF